MVGVRGFEPPAPAGSSGTMFDKEIAEMVSIIDLPD